jgi:SAM-dependent methyltransferase
MSTSPVMFDALVIQNLLGVKFLDVGCGHGKWGYLVKKYRRRTPEGSVSVTGVDLFEPHIAPLVREGVYDSVMVASAINMPFADKSFDSTIACEILEHLSQADGKKLITELTRVSRLSFVVTTPNFACLRGGCKTLNGFNEYEAHLYNYSYKEFCTLGFTQVVGMGLKTPFGKPSRIFGSLGYFFPRFSRYFVGFWFADGKKRLLEIE